MSFASVRHKMVKPMLLVIFCLVSISPAFSDPGVSWVYTPESMNNYGDWMQRLHLDRSGNILATGTSFGDRDLLDTTPQDQIMSILIESRGGSVLRRDTYGTLDEEYGYDGVQTDTGLVLIGRQRQTFYDDCVHNPTPACDDPSRMDSWAYWVKTDETGNQTAAASLLMDLNARLTDTLITSTENYLVVSNTGSPGQNYFSTVTLADAEGGVLWQTVLDTELDLYLYKVIETSDGGYLLTGQTGPDIFSQGYLTVIKLSAAGFVQFSNSYPQIAYGSNLALAGENEDKSYLIVTSLSGERIWTNHIGINGEELGQAVSRRILTHEFDTEQPATSTGYLSGWEHLQHGRDEFIIGSLIRGHNGGWLLGGELLTHPYNYFGSPEYRVPYLIRLDDKGTLTGDLVVDVSPFEITSWPHTTPNAGGFVPMAMVNELIADQDGGYVAALGPRSGRGISSLVKFDSDNFEIKKIPLAIQVVLQFAQMKKNTVAFRSFGSVEVAILSTPDFDASTVNPASLRLAGFPVAVKKNGAIQFRLTDVDGDRQKDLVAEFRTGSTLLDGANCTMEIDGETLEGLRIQGEASAVFRAK